MLEVTEIARERLKVLLDANTEDPEDGIRLTLGEDQKLDIVISKEKPGDQVIEHEGAKVLLLEPIVAEALSNIIVDTEDSSSDSKFILREKTEN